MVAKLLRHLAGLSASMHGNDGTLAGQEPRIDGRVWPQPLGDPLPSAWVRLYVWRRDHGKCVECGGQERVWFDYIVPVWKGGSNTEQNMRLMCERCHHNNKGVRIRRKKLGI
jgi:HNH endonuclease